MHKKIYIICIRIYIFIVIFTVNEIHVYKVITCLIDISWQSANITRLSIKVVQESAMYAGP